MTLRFKISPGRILISKPGYDCNTVGLADRNKIFDSNWNFSGYMLESGFGSWDTSDKDKSTLGCLTNDSSPVTIPFKRTYNFRPAAIVVGYFNQEQPFNDVTGYAAQGAYAFAGAGSTIYNDRIVLNRVPKGSAYYAFETMRYVLYGVF
ncbi:hypothetical protein EVB53_042 [Rhizobium phage RHph_Y60]|nr:hypothetical protein EVB53_042 [Rhizobium phage RHph_Y60]